MAKAIGMAQPPLSRRVNNTQGSFLSFLFLLHLLYKSEEEEKNEKKSKKTLQSRKGKRLLWKVDSWSITMLIDY